MSLDIDLIKEIRVYETNITHNLGPMAKELGVYKYLWRPEEININEAKQLIKPLARSIIKLEKNPEYYKKFNAKNGWGTYEDFLPWLKELLLACEKNPGAKIRVSR